MTAAAASLRHQLSLDMVAANANLHVVATTPPLVRSAFTPFPAPVIFTECKMWHPFLRHCIYWALVDQSFNRSINPWTSSGARHNKPRLSSLGGYRFAADSMSLSYLLTIFIQIYTAISGRKLQGGSSRSYKIIETGTNSKLVCEYLLIFHCN